MKQRQLSEDEFARVCAKSRLKPATHSIAHAILVGGRRQVDVAAEIGASRAWVHQAVTKFWSQFEAMERSTLPKGWRSETIALPRDAWPKVRLIEREARARLKKPIPKNESNA